LRKEHALATAAVGAVAAAAAAEHAEHIALVVADLPQDVL
jgi:hypothetical protein